MGFFSNIAAHLKADRERRQRKIDDGRKQRAKPKANNEAKRDSTSRWYWFHTPEGRTKPKSYSGPYYTQAEAVAASVFDKRELGGALTSYAIRKLTPAQFLKLWGAYPQARPRGF